MRRLTSFQPIRVVEAMKILVLFECSFVPGRARLLRIRRGYLAKRRSVQTAYGSATQASPTKKYPQLLGRLPEWRPQTNTT